MKLLVLQETDWIKRGPHQQHHLMDRMALRGHEIHVIDYDYLWKDDRDKKMITGRKEIRGAFKIFKDADITLIRPGMIKISGLDYASILYFHNKEIKKQIREFKPDVIIAFSILNAYLGMRQAKKNNILFIYYLIDHLHTLLPGRLKRSIAKQFERATLKGADKILVISKGLKDYAVEMGGDINKISVIPAGVDLERFNPQVDGSEIREKYGIKKDEILLFFMGWIYEFSGMKEVAESISTTDNEKIKLMIVGEGDLYEPLLRMRLQEFGISTNGSIRFIDPVDYLDFMNLEKGARLVLTDSGGVQEEACILGVPCVTLRDNTERPETVEVGVSNMLAGTEPDKIVESARKMLVKGRGWNNPFGDGRAAEDCKSG